MLHQFESVLWHARWEADPVARFRNLGEEFMRSGGASVPIYVFRSAALRRSRMLGNYSAADWILLVELVPLGTFVEIEEPLSLIRSHPESSSLGKDRQRMDRMQAFLDPSTYSGRLGLWLSRSRRYLEYYNAIRRSPLPARSKLALCAYHSGTLVRRARKNVWRAVNGRQLRPAHH